MTPRDWKADLATFRALGTTTPASEPEPIVTAAPAIITTPAAPPVEPPRRSGSLSFQGIHRDILDLCARLDSQKLDFTPEVNVEGSLNCGKTTMGIFRQLDKLRSHPDMWGFAYRYSETDNKTKLRPAIELIANIMHEKLKWDGGEMFYGLENGARLYSFGLKAVDLLSRYDKLRGLGVSDIYNDQAESTPKDIHEELRARLRPDLRMTLMQKEYPRLYFLTPNPAGHRHWLTNDYPEDNHIEGRYYFRISAYDNAHNIGPQAIRSLESSYPPTHAKHGPMVLGKRGMSVIGDAIFEDTFSRALHVREVNFDHGRVLYEAFDMGKHCPTWVAAQRGYGGGWTYLGGVIGQDVFLEDFLPFVMEQRKAWFGSLSKDQVKTCHLRSSRAHSTDMRLLLDLGLHPLSSDNANSPDVMLTMIEQLASYMRRRDVRGQEMLTVDASEIHWLRLSKEGCEPFPFMAQGFEAGMVWDEHLVSVANKQVRKLKEDDWFEHGLQCAIAMEVNFGRGLTLEQLKARELENRQQGYGGNDAGISQSKYGWMA